MTFAAPLALLALLPLGVAAWRLLRGRPREAAVPMLTLWPTTAATAANRHRRRPPLAVILLLLAAMLAVLASAGPRLGGPFGLTRLNVKLVADVGPGDRLAEAESRAADLLENAAGTVVVDRVEVEPGDVATAAAAALRRGETVVAVTDRPLIGFDGLIRVRPATGPTAAVLDATADDAGVAVTLIAEEAATLTVQAGDEVRRVEVAASPGGPVVVPLDLGSSDEVRVLLNGGEAAVLRRVRGWPRLEVAADVPPAVRKVAGAFAEARPPSTSSKLIGVSTRPPNGVGVQVAAATEPAGELRAVRPLDFVGGVDWPALQGVRRAPPPVNGWAAVVLDDRDRPAVAVREVGGSRQAWVGFDAAGFDRTPAFVRFWADLLTWLNGGEPAWQTTLNRPPPGQSGLMSTAERADAMRTLAAHRTGPPLAPPLLAAAAVLVLAAAEAAKRVDSRPADV